MNKLDNTEIKRYLLLITAEEWNHDADEWLGIYLSDAEVKEAYKRANEWFQIGRENGRYSTMQEVMIYRFDLEADSFVVVAPESL